MKKNLSRVLALALVLASLLSLTVGASADGTKVVIPNKISRLAPQLPEREAQPTVRTKTANGEIMVRVSGDPDSVMANWLGYGESKEEVDLENGIGIVELEGHKYQLGARWNKVQNRKYYVLNVPTLSKDEDGVLGFHEGDAYAWEKVDYKGTVKVGNYTMKVYDGDYLYQDIFPANQKENTYWAWIYESPAPEMDHIVSNPEEPVPAEPVEGTEGNIYGAGDVGKKGVIGGLTEYGRADSDVVAKDNIVLYDVASLSLEDEVAANFYAQDSKGNEGKYTGWLPMVPDYMFREEVTGRESNGAPNYAWIVTKGPWTATYTRSGKLEIVVKDEENTDYFKTGLAGSTGTVTWQHRKTAAGTTWYVSEVVENYAEGDIAQAIADYNVNGELVKYWITYRTGENETYRIRYTKDNKPAYGNYTGVDEFTGEKITAYSNSLKTWRDNATGKLTSQVELDWGLTALKDWTNPPRLTK